MSIEFTLPPGWRRQKRDLRGMRQKENNPTRIYHSTHLTDEETWTDEDGWGLKCRSHRIVCTETLVSWFPAWVLHHAYVRYTWNWWWKIRAMIYYHFTVLGVGWARPTVPWFSTSHVVAVRQSHPETCSLGWLGLGLIHVAPASGSFGVPGLLKLWSQRCLS